MLLAGIEKGGYFPYPPPIAEATASWFIPLPQWRRRHFLVNVHYYDLYNQKNYHQLSAFD
jgi:hypothetical protein